MDKTVEVSQAARDAAGEVFKVSPAMNEAWCAYEPVGQFAEQMSFARFNGMLRHAFLSGYAATTRATQPEAALREAVAQIIAKDASNEPDLGLLRQTHETGFKGGIRYCANILAAALKDHRHG